MPNPYIILGVENRECDDQTVRDAYLRKIRQFPPETAPAEFRLINEAYEKLKSRTERVRFALFDSDPDAISPMDCLREPALIAHCRRPPELNDLKEHIKQCQKLKS